MTSAPSSRRSEQSLLGRIGGRAPGLSPSRPRLYAGDERVREPTPCAAEHNRRVLFPPSHPRRVPPLRAANAIAAPLSPRYYAPRPLLRSFPMTTDPDTILLETE